MKTFILTKNNFDNFNEIKVDDVYSIYQDKFQSFSECLIINLKIKNNKNLDKYIIKEINLDTDEVDKIYKIENNNYIRDITNNIKYKIPSNNTITDPYHL